jgi:uracil-DNA glycosylase
VAAVISIGGERKWVIGGEAHYTRFVPDDGPEDAELLLIGEAPGKIENGWTDNHMRPMPRPFVGPSGRLLNQWWESVGLVRRSFRITNVFPYWPPFKDFKDAIKSGQLTKDELEQWVEALHDKITGLPNLRIIVPTGNIALHALTGKRNITNWRGSILEYVARDGRHIKVIPTLHPAGFFRDPTIERRCKIDWARIVNDLDIDGLDLPVRDHIIPFDDRAQYKQRLIAWRDRLYELHKSGKVKYLVPDIETVGDRITCIGFAYRKNQSVTIPLDDHHYWQTAADRAWAWAFVKDLLESELEKVFQNGLYDVFWLTLFNIRVKKWFWDTLAMHHCLDASDSHSLEYMASVDTREPFWKKESKEAVDKKKNIRDWAAYWRYNGKDVCVTFEVFSLYYNRLLEAGLLPFYDQFYRRLFKPLLGLMLHGINVDNKLRKRTWSRLKADEIDIQDELEELAGYALQAKKVLSRDKIVKYLFEDLKLPVIYLTDSDLPSTNIIALRSLFLGYQNKIQRAQNELNSGKRTTAKAKARRINDIARWQIACKALDLIMKFRKTFQTSTFFSDKRVDADGRMRCTFHYNTKFSRLSSSESPNGSGTNLQNQQRDIPGQPSVRSIFVPDAGCFIIDPDLSQAEARVVGMWSHDKELMRLARTPSWEFDVHAYNASIIFKIQLDELQMRLKAKDPVAKEMRQCAKRAVHGSNYLMSGMTLADVILKEMGLVRTPDECQAMIDSYIEGMPGVGQYHDLTWQEVLHHRELHNTWGRVYHFENYRLDQETKRLACAARPQGEVPDIINQWGLIPAYWKFVKTKQYRILAQVHDSMPYTAPLDDLPGAYASMKWLRESLERPRSYDGEEMTIWCSFKIGMTMAGDVEFEKFPDYKQFEEGVHQMLEKHQKVAA